MAAREVLVLNEDTSEIQAPQAGDTYTAPRAFHFADAVTTSSTINGRDPAADYALLDSALQPGDAATTAQGDLADTALQLADVADVAISGDSDDLTEGTVKLLLTAAERAKLGFVSVTQAVNLDTLEAKLDFLTVTQAVNLDTLESDVAALDTKLDFITVTQAVDLDVLETDVAAAKAELAFITVTQAVDLDALEASVVAHTASLASIQGHTAGMVAYAGGGQLNGTPLNQGKNVFTTVTTVADSGKLPSASAGMEVTVINRAANSMDVFPNTSDNINALAVDTAYALAGGSNATFYAVDNVTWVTI